MNKKLVLATLTLLSGFASVPAHASDEAFVGEIEWVPFNFAPRGFALCAGQIMSISQNTALFSLLGTTYGGNGTSTFALPDMRGRSPISAGQGPGLTNRVLGEAGGQESVALTVDQLPPHSHTLSGTEQKGNQIEPTGAALALPAQKDGTGGVASSDVLPYWKNSETAPSPVVVAHLADNAVGSSGNNLPHNNMPPYLPLHCIIALQGIFPSRP